MSKEKKSFILKKSINKNTKLIPFAKRQNFLGEVKYFPASSKEWKNSVYFFNAQNMKNLPVYDLNINKLIKGYFNLYFNHEITTTEFNSSKIKRLSFNKIFVSKGEVQHTNSKAIITIYIYNREKISLLKNINKFITFINSKKNKLKFMNKRFRLSLIKNTFFKKVFFIFHKGKKIYNNLSLDCYQKAIKLIFYKKLIFIRRFVLKLNLNKFKLEEKFLHKLAKLISKFYKKKVEFNIINLNSIILNSDLFTEILSLKLKKQRINVLKMMNVILTKVNLSNANRFLGKTRNIKTINFDIFENKYKNSNISNILGFASKQNFNEFFHKLYNQKNFYISDKVQKQTEKSSSYRIKSILLNKIKYKILGGIRLEVKGRLTKRYRADRALFKVKWKGGLKNIDSSFRGLSSVKYRGFVNSNLQYSINASKRRIGSFAVKGWISGK
jgi:hypothetical protein